MADEMIAAVGTEVWAGNREQRRGGARRSKKFAAIGSGAVLIAGVAGPGSVMFASPAAAATITVDSLTDDGTGTTLRDAIDAANADAGPDTITFTAGLTGTINLTSDLPSITETLSIVGPGAEVLGVDGDGNQIFYFYDIDSGTNVVSGLTLTGGYNSYGGAINLRYGGASLEVRNMVITGNEADNEGGGVSFYDSTGSLVISGSLITDNTAGQEGGGVFLYDTGAVTITGTTISGNTAGSEGGGVFLYDTGAVTITGTTISGNTAGQEGGGVYFDDTGAVTITGTTISDNTAGQEGGGVYFQDTGAVTITGTTISGNTAGGEGGGVMVVDVGSLMVEFSTISDNSAGGDGGGFYIRDTDVTIESSTISGNVAEGGGGGGGGFVGNGSGYSFTMRNSTVSGNAASNYGGGLYFQFYGPSTVENSTISGNIAYQSGGIFTYGFLSLIQSTVTDNTATATEVSPVGGVHVGGVVGVLRTTLDDGDSEGASRPAAVGGSEVELIGTIVAGNDGEDVGSYDGTATATSTFSMLGTVGADITVTDVGGTQLGVSDAGLAPLAANGGPTRTHALLDGSVALNAGPDPVPSFPGNQFDQRGSGFARVAFGFVDVGAFEAQEDEPVVPPPSPDPGAAPADAVVAPKFTG